MMIASLCELKFGKLTALACFSGGLKFVLFIYSRRSPDTCQICTRCGRRHAKFRGKLTGGSRGPQSTQPSRLARRILLARFFTQNFTRSLAARRIFSRRIFFRFCATISAQFKYILRRRRPVRCLHFLYVFLYTSLCFVLVNSRCALFRLCISRRNRLDGGNPLYFESFLLFGIFRNWCECPLWDGTLIDRCDLWPAISSWYRHSFSWLFFVTSFSQYTWRYVVMKSENKEGTHLTFGNLMSSIFDERLEDTEPFGLSSLFTPLTPSLVLKDGVLGIILPSCELSRVDISPTFRSDLAWSACVVLFWPVFVLAAGFRLKTPKKGLSKVSMRSDLVTCWSYNLSASSRWLSGK